LYATDTTVDLDGSYSVNAREMEDIVTPNEVVGRESFNGRYAVVRWDVSGKTTVGQVKKSLEECLPEEVGKYGRVSKKRDEVRVVLRFQRKPHYTDVLKHLELKGQTEQRVYLAKLERPETWEQFVEKGVKYVQCLRGGKVFGRVGSLVPAKAEAKGKASIGVESEGCVDEDEVEESEDDGNEGDSALSSHGIPLCSSSISLIARDFIILFAVAVAVASISSICFQC
jgi:hypothetical protein